MKREKKNEKRGPRKKKLGRVKKIKGHKLKYKNKKLYVLKRQKNLIPAAGREFMARIYIKGKERCVWVEHGVAVQPAFLQILIV